MANPDRFTHRPGHLKRIAAKRWYTIDGIIEQCKGPAVSSTNPMDDPAPLMLQGVVLANGSFPYCNGCELMTMVDARSGGLGAPTTVASIACTAILIVLFGAAWFVARYNMKGVYYAETTTKGGAKARIDKSCAVWTFATALTLVVTVVPESTNSLGAAYLILYPASIFFTVYAELWTAICIYYVLAIRATRIYRDFIKVFQTTQLLVNIGCVPLGLLAAGRTGLSIWMTVLSTTGSFSLTVFWRLEGIMSILTVASKSYYLALSVAFVLAAFRYRRLQSESGHASKIPRYVILATIAFFVWAALGLMVFALVTYARVLFPRATYIVNAFLYILPIFVCLALIITAARQEDWFFDERDHTAHGVPQPYPDPNQVAEQEAEQKWREQRMARLQDLWRATAIHQQRMN